MPRLLELFSGTGSVGRAFKDRGWEVVSLDIDPKAATAPTICCDILKWDETAYPKDYFSMIWSSPLCTYYSKARTLRKSTEAELQYSDSLVQRTLEIIKYFGTHWAFENPASGLLKNREFLQQLNLPFKDVTYCKYGARYRKATRIWNSLSGDYWQPKPVCCKASRCAFFANGLHPATAQRGPCRGGKRVGDDFTQNQLYHIPQELCDEIARAAESALRENAAVHPEGTSVERQPPEELRGN